MIFDIQRFSVHDGPGIRTTVFFKGCNLRCRWCHNPESWTAGRQLERYPDRCIGCGRCLEVCPTGAMSASGYLSARCSACGACADVCPADALRMAGREASAEEILRLALRDLDFYGEEGGLTCSGGECMLQMELLEALLRGAKSAGLSTTVDTAGLVEYERFTHILPCTDLFLYDIKAVSAQLHRRMTGQDNTLILQNLKKLVRDGARVWVRIPCVPGAAAERTEMHAIGAFLQSVGGVERVEVLNYHRLGAGKHEALSGTYPMPENAQPLTVPELDERVAILQSYGLNALHNKA